MAAAPDGDPSSPKLPPKVSTYEVAAGDTLLGIAHNFGITPETILWANGMASEDLLRIGQKLTILPVSGVLHNVKPGESVLSIAAAYNADPAKIVEANQISDPSLVREGDLLLVPGGIMKAGGATAPAQDADPATKYAVKEGDSLYSIADAFGVRVAAIASANNLPDSDVLKIGQTLSIPGGNTLAANPAPADAPTAAPAPEPAAEGGQDREPSNRGDQRDGKSFVANVTAYAMQGRTATGSTTRWGVIAVDPATIPLGSKVRIDGFEELFVAEDTGGGIKDNWIDLWFPTYADAMRFGTQARRVTIVEP